MSAPPPSPVTVLGIETSCDETAAAVVRLGVGPGDRPEVLSSVIATQFERHRPYGGVVPEIAARAHAEVIDTVIRAAMAESGLGFGGLGGVAATAGPGLIGGVMVGLAAGKAVALARDLPLIAVNHLEGHALSPRLTEDAPYPYLLLLVSGGHCQLLSVEGVGRCTRLGTTIDDAAGEAFDKIAMTLGLGYPGGPALERLAATGDPTRFALPRMLLGRAGCDFSFSGLKTAAARQAAGLSDDAARADLAAAVQQAIARQLAERTARAITLHLQRFGEAGRVLAVAGGVAANGAVRAALAGTAAAHGFRFVAPPLKYCTDNAAMIALAGAERLQLGLTDTLDVAARPRWPLDEATALSAPVHAPGRKGAKA